MLLIGSYNIFENRAYFTILKKQIRSELNVEKRALFLRQLSIPSVKEKRDYPVPTVVHGQWSFEKRVQNINAFILSSTKNLSCIRERDRIVRFEE